MGSQTRISWTDHTWNPWQGCRKVSSGCANCYMFAAKAHWGKDPRQVQRSAPTTFNAPLRWSEPAKVFACSWSDWFIEDADPWRGEAWGIVRATPHLTYQILTKRPENILARLPSDWDQGWPNVWLGVSAEDQPRLDERAGILARIPARVRFLSAEPLLGPLNILLQCRCGHVHGTGRPCKTDDCPCSQSHPVFDQVIIGAESGPHRREMQMADARSIIAQCRAAGVACFVKQDSALGPGQQGRFTDAELALKEMPR